MRNTPRYRLRDDAGAESLETKNMNNVNGNREKGVKELIEFFFR